MANRTTASEKLEARLPHDLVDAVRQYASRHRCSVSDLIKEGLELRLEQDPLARMPQELVDSARHYASQHQCTVADLLREGLALRLKAALPGRDTPHLALDPAGLAVVAEALAPRILTWLETTMRGQTEGRPRTNGGHTQVRPYAPYGQTEDRPLEVSAVPPLPEGLTVGRPPAPRQHYRHPEQQPTFDPTRYVVGALCPKQHRYQGQAGSLRYLHGDQVCVTCRRARNQRYNAQKRARQAQRLTAPQSG